MRNWFVASFLLFSAVGCSSKETRADAVTTDAAASVDVTSADTDGDDAADASDAAPASDASPDAEAAAPACHDVAIDIAGWVRGTIRSGAVFTGTGGTILDGTYVLTSVTSDEASAADEREVLEIKAGVVKSVWQVFATYRDTLKLSTSGTDLELTTECSSDWAVTGVPTKYTYTATDTSLEMMGGAQTLRRYTKR
jgi:hypothetical protein